MKIHADHQPYRKKPYVARWYEGPDSAKASKGKLQPKSPPKNALRHSFVTYHVALHRDPGRTALLVSHKDQAILWEHYIGVATNENAVVYFSILPSPGSR